MILAQVVSWIGADSKVHKKRHPKQLVDSLSHASSTLWLVVMVVHHYCLCLVYHHQLLLLLLLFLSTRHRCMNRLECWMPPDIVIIIIVVVISFFLFSIIIIITNSSQFRYWIKTALSSFIVAFAMHACKRTKMANWSMTNTREREKESWLLTERKSFIVLGCLHSIWHANRLANQSIQPAQTAQKEDSWGLQRRLGPTNWV